MKTQYSIAIVLVATIGSGLLGWYIFRPSPTARRDQIYGRMAMSIGVDKSWWVKVGGILYKATHQQCGEMTASDYDELYKALRTGVPGAQRPAMMAINSCPPPDRGACYANLNALAQRTTDATVQVWAFDAMWRLAPDKRDEIRRAASASKLTGVSEEVAQWGEEPVRK